MFPNNGFWSSRPHDCDGWTTAKPVMFHIFGHNKHIFRCYVAGALCLILVACGSRVDTRGNPLDPERLSEIKSGEITREEVLEMIGSPSNITTFGNEKWYYIAEQTETIAFFAPKVVGRQVVILHFDKQGVLEKLQTLDAESGRRVQHVERTTPTYGNKLTALEQIIGNFQRFTKDEPEDTNVPTRIPTPSY